MATNQPLLMAAGGSGTALGEQIIHREGASWTITFDGMTCRMRSTRGLNYLAYLLCRPHEDVSALVLEQSASQGLPETRAIRRVALGDARERARINATRAIATALRRIEKQHPRLAAHLRATIKTGAFCRYTPDPRLPVHWRD